MKGIRKTVFVVLVGCVIGSAAFTRQAQATMISGSIAFSGVVTLNTASAGSATAVTGWGLAGPPLLGLPYVSGADGDFSPALSNFAVFAAPWFFNIPPGPAMISFWSTTGFTFDLLSSAVIAQGFDANGNGFVFVSGTGTVHHAGFDPTPGTWAFTTQDPSGSGIFSFSASGATVPDGGSTVALLGLALAGIGWVRRRFKD